MLRIGKAEVEVFTDAPFWLDGGQMFGTVPKALWQKDCPADANNLVRLECNCYLVTSGGRRVLVDSGIGCGWDEKWCKIYGIDQSGPTLLDRLAARGYGPESIDAVLLTHLHFDHCGWSTRPDGAGGFRTTFPNAEYIIHRQEWEDAHDRDARAAASYVGRLFDPIEPAGQLKLIEGGGQIDLGRGLHAIVTGGHTRAHLAWRIDSDGHHALGLADLVPFAAHRRARWLTPFDLYPVESLAAKRRWLAAAAEGSWPMMLNHEPDHPFRRAVLRGKDLDFEPLEA